MQKQLWKTAVPSFREQGTRAPLLLVDQLDSFGPSRVPEQPVSPRGIVERVLTALLYLLIFIKVIGLWTAEWTFFQIDYQGPAW